MFEESRALKELMPKSTDALMVLSLFDTCLIATTQLDAYFSMIGLFETVKKEDLTPAGIDFILGWLTQIKNTNELNLKSLDSIQPPLEEGTKSHIAKLKAYFVESNLRVTAEAGKLGTIKKSLKIVPAPKPEQEVKPKTKK
jgi:hypothetical protein